jgi:hypothetical protein
VALRWRWAALVALGVIAAVVVALYVASPSRSAGCDAEHGNGRIGGSDGADMLTMSDADLAGVLDAARAAGMWSVRVDVDWSRVEPQKGKRDWSEVDRVVHAVAERGMCPLGLVTYAPAWAADPALRATGTYFAPRDPQLFADFAAAAAGRYRDDVTVWEVWNEPNTVKFFRPRPDADAYGRLLTATYAAVKAVSTHIAVISGGLAPAKDNGRDVAPTTFLSALYARGYNRSFDAFSIHPYSYPALPDAPGTAVWNTAQRMGIMRSTMVAGGDAGKQIWITECGAPTGTAAVAVSEDVQAQTLRIVLGEAKGSPWIGPAFVYSIRDSGSDVADAEQNFGILRHDLTPKPAYRVVSEFGKDGS